jgi:endonuclease-3 related protein
LTGRERTAEILHAIYRELLGQYGAQKWWPLYTGSAWEIMIGAVLTQHTTWSNVELALNNILSVWGPEGLSRPEMMLEAQTETLAALVRPAGFYTAKPLKLQNLARFVVERGGLEQFAASPESTENLRTELLGVWGIGPETADAILLYVLDRPVFVADAYAKRLGMRWGLLDAAAGYGAVQRLYMEHLPPDVEMFKEYHALIVAHGKDLCRPKPRCELCPLGRPVRLDNREGAGAENGEVSSWECPRLYIIQRR